MKYKIIDIEGIGNVYAEKLTAMGITTTDDLLKAGLTEVGRDLIAEKTGIPSKLIYKWTNQADLFRVNGIGPQFAELLNAAGVNSVGQLAAQKAPELEAKLKDIDEHLGLTRRVPSVGELETMISLAATVEPVLPY